LKTNRGLVEVSTLVEAENLVVSTSQLECKKIMAGQTEVKLQKGPFDSHIGAIYSSTCMINSASKGKLHIGNSHGYLRIVGEELTKVQVDSINGSFELEDSGEKCDVVAHFDTWHPESDNSILVGGNVKISLDPSTAMEVELHGQNIITTNCQLADGKLEHLDENYAVFNGEIKPDPTVTSVTTADRSGKINVGAARNAALSTSFFMKEDKAKSSNVASIKTQDDEHELGDEDDENHTLTPLNKNPEIARLLVHATGGQVQLEQSNWMDKLKRKLLTENKS
jgi:hypothetical protein